MISATLFYFAMTILLIGSLTVPAFAQNPNLNLFNSFNKNIQILGLIIMLSIVISTKANSTMQLSLYSSVGAVATLSRENYIPKKLGNVNKKNVFGNAILLNIVLSIIVSVLLLIIPDIIMYTEHLKKAIINYATITMLSSLMLVITYVIVLVLAILLRYKHKHKSISDIDVIIWIIGLLLIGLQIFLFFFNFVKSFVDINLNTPDGIQNLVLSVSELVYFLFVLIIPIVWYYSYYKPILNNRIKTTPEIQKELDSHFVILVDDKESKLLIRNGIKHISKITNKFISKIKKLFK